MKLKKPGSLKLKPSSELRASLQAGMMGLVLSATVAVMALKVGTGYAAAFGAISTFLVSFFKPKAKKDHSISFSSISEPEAVPAQREEKEETTLEIPRPDFSPAPQVEPQVRAPIAPPAALEVTAEIETTEPVLVMKPAPDTAPPPIPASGFPNSNSAVMFLSAKVPKTDISKPLPEPQAKTVITVPEFEFPKTEEEEVPVQLIMPKAPSSPPAPPVPEVRTGSPGLHNSPMAKKSVTVSSIGIEIPEAEEGDPVAAPFDMAPPPAAPKPPPIVDPTPPLVTPPPAAPQLSVAAAKWKIHNGAKVIGPFTAKEIAERLYAQELDFDCLCWRFDEANPLPDPALDSASVLPIQKAAVFGRQDEDGSIYWIYNWETLNGPVSQAYVRTALVCGEIGPNSVLCKESTITGWMSVHDWNQALKTGQAEEGSPKRVA